ncbi:MAG: hypothetical protein L6406_01425 [Desulfobacterales bacterium]|nr:hypothetical protein [Desulfobacterales bacterium]
MGDQSRPKFEIIRVTAEPGVCGFSCIIEAQKKASDLVSIKITGSECKQIQRLSRNIREMNLRELFTPLTQNPVYTFAKKAGCHASCPIPMAILKAVEVAMDMAIPRDVLIRFESSSGEKSHEDQ